ncbi:unnamed protein product [Brassica oleracea]|uniref:(rape) hypothetical protein n=1 Tax=Brassica napus TaxID=3708 RepID=A0A816RHE7_BRANA|nr:unnamed protein product [Brassica napus]
MKICFGCKKEIFDVREKDTWTKGNTGRSTAVYCLMFKGFYIQVVMRREEEKRFSKVVGANGSVSPRIVVPPQPLEKNSSSFILILKPKKAGAKPEKVIGGSDMFCNTL